VKNFIKTNCCSDNKKYGLNELTTLAVQISKDSEGEYTEKGAMSVLCKYVHVQNGELQFDPNARNHDQSYETIKQKLCESVSVKEREDQMKKMTTMVKSAKGPEKKVQETKRGGFGRFGHIDMKVKKHADSDDECEKVDVDESKNQKEEVKVSQSQSQSRSQSQSQSQSKGGFGKFKKTTISQPDPDNECIGRKNTQYSTDANASTSTSMSTSKSVSIGSGGGFGKFKKMITRPDSDDESIGRKKSNKKVNKIGYNYPVELKYPGVIRTDPAYGPYGVDNYYDIDMKSDALNGMELKRVGIYRKLASLIYPAQRSPEWFAMRDKMITASDGGTIVRLNPYEHESGFISKKVHGKPFDTNIDCYHGKKYEQVATMIYELRMNVMVKEFGLCQHPVHDFLGASPDGIVSEYKLKTKDGRIWQEIEKEANQIREIEKRREYIAEQGFLTKYVGRMLEIKCPRTRKILMDPNAPEVYGPHGEEMHELYKDVKKGVCPAYYWVQVQLQLQCCELDECDFWQCTITEYTDRDDFIADTDQINPWLSLHTKREKGAVIQLIPRKQLNNRAMDYDKRLYNFAEFIHQPRLDMTPCELDQWIRETIQNLAHTHKDPDGNSENDLMFERVLYWKLDNSRNITIPRDDKWFADNLPIFKQAWDYVIYFRNNKDQSVLLKKYLESLPKDKYNKMREIVPGTVMGTIDKLYNQPDEKMKKEYQVYQKFIQTLTKETSNIPDQKQYDVVDDVDQIKKIMDHVVKEIKDCTSEDRNKLSGLLDIIKSLKFEAESHIDPMDI